MDTAELIQRLDRDHAEIKSFHQNADRKMGEFSGRLTEVEQTLAQRRSPGGNYAPETLGSFVVKSDEYKRFMSVGCNGNSRIEIDTKTVTAATGSAGGLIVPDHQRDPTMMPRTRLTVRNLLAKGETTSNLVKFTKQTGRINAAAVVTEGGTKPTSDIQFTLEDAPVRVIATLLPVSRQAMDDAPQLQSLIDTELRYFIGLAEEEEILFGDGTGEHLKGLSSQVTPYDAPFTVTAKTNLDTILVAIAQAQQSKIAATGVIMNDLDWLKMQSIKDSQQRYILNGPGGTIGNSLWTLPVVPTPAMPENEFMVGAFAIAAQVIDRMRTEVLISSEHNDNFARNMLTVRAEERVALAIKMPEAIVYGDFSIAT